MKAKIIFVDLNKLDAITKEKLEEMLDEAYDQGYNRGYCDGVRAGYPVLYPYNYKENWIPTWNDDTTKTNPRWDKYQIYCDGSGKDVLLNAKDCMQGPTTAGIYPDVKISLTKDTTTTNTTGLYC